jgi:hypothetical protein
MSGQIPDRVLDKALVTLCVHLVTGVLFLGRVINYMSTKMKQWGKQYIKCPSCKTPSTMTFETAYDDLVSDSYCVRYFERLCANCLYWSGWIWVNNGKVKLPIQ